MAHRTIVVMGVSAVGKSTIAQALSERVGALCLDADDFHPPQNVAAMRSGRPLTDEMRLPWLQAIGDACRHAARDTSVVVACSALKRRYRDVLRERVDRLTFVHATAPRDVLEKRIESREGHYMPPSLLQSQIDTLEPPGPDEHAITVDATQPPEAIVDRICGALPTP